MARKIKAKKLSKGDIFLDDGIYYGCHLKIVAEPLEYISHGVKKIFVWVSVIEKNISLYGKIMDANYKVVTTNV